MIATHCFNLTRKGIDYCGSVKHIRIEKNRKYLMNFSTGKSQAWGVEDGRKRERKQTNTKMARLPMDSFGMTPTGLRVN